MEKLLAYCGLDCGKCPAYIATQNDDMELRIKTAEEWSKMFNEDIKASHINCDGCTSKSDRIFGYCSTCGIRSCGVNSKVENCGCCSNYGCEKIMNFTANVPEARDNLEALRKTK